MTFVIIDSFAQFVVACEDVAYNEAPSDWRAGQTAFNLLVRVRPDLAELIRGSDFDPFHKDENLVPFYGFVCRHWDDALNAFIAETGYVEPTE